MLSTSQASWLDDQRHLCGDRTVQRSMLHPQSQYSE